MHVATTRCCLKTWLKAEGRIQLVTAPIDASSVDVVAQFPPVTYYLYPRWSPDGKWIALQRGDSIRFDVFVVPATGGEPRGVGVEHMFLLDSDGHVLEI